MRIRSIPALAAALILVPAALFATASLPAHTFLITSSDGGPLHTMEVSQTPNADGSYDATVRDWASGAIVDTGRFVYDSTNPAFNCWNYWSTRTFLAAYICFFDASQVKPGARCGYWGTDQDEQGNPVPWDKGPKGDLYGIK